MVEPILKMEVAGIKYTKPLRQETTCSEYSTRALSPLSNNTYPLMLQDFISQKGDKGAKLISELSQYIKSCAYQKGQLEIEDQKEILQEVMIKIFANHKKIKTNHRAWIFKVTYNECMNKLNKIISNKNLVEVYSKNEMIKYDINEGVVTRGNAINDLDCIEYAFTEATNSSSGDNDRKILHQYAVGFGNQEIANNTGRTASAINKKLSILKKRIRQLIIEYC